jgi:hypothetical protein
VWFGALLGLLLLAGWACAAGDRALRGHNDFMQLYAGASLIGTDGLYSIPANRRVLLGSAGVVLDGVNYTRLPFYAALLRPLAFLPYQSSYLAFELLSLGSLFAFTALFFRSLPQLPLIVAVSIPAFATLVNGQDVSIMLFLAGAAVVLIRRGRLATAGLLLACCAIKFHLLLLLPAALVVRREWRVLAGGLAGGTLLLIVSAAAAGLSWPRAYIQLLSNPITNPEGGTSPTLRTLCYGLGIPDSPGLLIASAAVAAAALIVCRRARSLEMALAAAIVGSLLICYHAGMHDSLLLLLAFVVIVTNAEDRALRSAAILIVLPPVYLCALMGPPASMLVPVAEVVLLLLFLREGPRFAGEPDCGNAHAAALPPLLRHEGGVVGTLR